MSKNATSAKKATKTEDLPEFVRIALQAQHRAARKLKAEHKRLGLPLIVWKDGKVVELKP